MSSCHGDSAPLRLKRPAPRGGEEGTGSGRPFVVALAGNPNAGKTSLFNAITGARHKVGNYPGVTVEKREGILRRGGRDYRFVDLPGIYSLTAYSIDEVVARDFLIDERPDLIVDVLDSSNLERNLYLCLQFQELGIPLVGALNMSDEAEAKGLRIDDVKLSELLGIPFARTVGTRGKGLEELLDLVELAALRFEKDEAASTGDHEEAPERRSLRYGDELEARLAPLEEALAADPAFSSRYPLRWFAAKLLEKDTNAFVRLAGHRGREGIEALARGASAWLEGHFGKDAEIVVTEQRYAYIRGAVREAVSVQGKPELSLTDRIDGLIMHPLLSLPLFLAVLWSVFQLTFTLGAYPMGWLEALFARLGEAASSLIPPGLPRSLVVDGMIGGVGGVFSFVPLIVILFLLLSILEDTGYLSRAAFATDKLLHSFGLHGQSVFPLMLGFGCSVPAIMAARTLKSPRDRIVTILVIPFMSCGAKLPVHVLLAGAFFPRNAAAMVMLVYAIGVVLALGSSLVLRKTLLGGKPTPFVMELPPYRAPTLRGIFWHVWEKSAVYFRKAGTVILASSMLIWAATTFPRFQPSGAETAAMEARAAIELPGASKAELGARVEAGLAELSLTRSWAGRLGRAIEPLIAPLGFDWKIGIATITGFAAKEIVVSTLGVLHSVGRSEGAKSEGLRAALRSDPAWSPLVGFALMLFILVIPPCFAALATIRAELGWGWLGFSVAFMLSLGWVLAFAVAQGGRLLGLSA